MLADNEVGVAALGVEGERELGDHRLRDAALQVGAGGQEDLVAPTPGRDLRARVSLPLAALLPLRATGELDQLGVALGGELGDLDLAGAEPGQECVLRARGVNTRRSEQVSLRVGRHLAALEAKADVGDRLELGRRAVVQMPLVRLRALHRERRREPEHLDRGQVLRRVALKRDEVGASAIAGLRFAPRVLTIAAPCSASANGRVRGQSFVVTFFGSGSSGPVVSLRDGEGDHEALLAVETAVLLAERLAVLATS